MSVLLCVQQVFKLVYGIPACCNLSVLCTVNILDNVGGAC